MRTLCPAVISRTTCWSRLQSRPRWTQSSREISSILLIHRFPRGRRPSCWSGWEQPVHHPPPVPARRPVRR